MIRSDKLRNASRTLAQFAAALLLVLASALPALGEDWPAYRHDSQRTSVSAEELAFPLKLAWSYRSAQPPQPAWGEQLNLVNRVDFDYAPHPIIADGLLFFASNADDTVRALDAVTGQEKWHYITGGPVRVPPQVSGGKIYFGSDDGVAYCLSAADGKLIWSFRGGPADETMLGNHRMISRWPVRSGVLVDDGVAYFVAGSWNIEGIFIYALNADSGQLVWCNDTVGFGGISFCDFIGMGVNGHHQGEFGAGGFNPQGPMGLGGEALLIPSGFGGIMRLSRLTGKAMAGEGGGPPGSGGTWLTVDGNRFFTFAMHGQSHNILTIVPYPLDGSAPGRAWGAGAVPQLSIGPVLKPGEIHQKGKVSAVVHKGALYARAALGLTLAGSTLLQGQEGQVLAERAQLLTSAQLRFGMAGEDLLLHALVADQKVIQADKPWKGSCIEIFGAADKEIGQVFLIPGSATAPPAAFRAADGGFVAAPEIRVISNATADGYELSALIPLSLLKLKRGAPPYRLEAQVTVTGPSGTVQRDTLFGSPLAYQDATLFRPQPLKPLPKVPELAALAATLKATAPLSIRMRGSSEIWRSPLEGKARELVVANGRLYVGTESGVIHCFMADSAAPAAPAVIDPAAQLAKAPAADSPLLAQTLAQLRQQGVERGLALVIGDEQGLLARGLVRDTRLEVISVLSDAQAAAALRETLLTSTTWYGSRISVRSVDKLGQLPFAQFCANAVIVAAPAAGLSGKELYRVLHPCGGVLLCPGLPGEAAAKLAQEAPVLAGELPGSAGGASIVRGKLPGALDWDSKRGSADQRVKWPLRPLWFGGPSTLQIRNYRQGAAGPTVGNGRYFIKSETTLTGVDAYNGLILWTRTIPQETQDIRAVNEALYLARETKGYPKTDIARTLYTNDDAVMLALGPAYFRGQSAGSIELDARTGEQTAVYGPYIAPPVVNLSSAQSWPVELDDKHSGTVTLEKSAAGLVVTLVSKDPAVCAIDSWELYFDFRPMASRYGLYGRETFHLRVTPALDSATPATCREVRGEPCPSFAVTGTPQADGASIVVTLPWADVVKFLGKEPDSFSFAAALNSHDGGAAETIQRRHLFGDWAADGINNGWATVVFDSATAAAAAVKPAILADAKTRKGMGLVGAGARVLGQEVSVTPRIHPLTGELEPKVYRPSTLCGGAFFSEQVMSGRAGFYDFVDDSGLRFLGGIKSRCTSPQVVALGMILVSEETGHCSCNYPYRTSLAMAPAERRLNEDWAVFSDREADTVVRHAAVNLGAPGDRRDDAGALWLGFPRGPGDKGMGYPLAAGAQHAVTAPGVWMRFMPSVFQVPLQVASFDGPEAYQPEEDTKTKYKWASSWSANRLGTGYGPRRVNGDRMVVSGSDRPWIYASYFRGIREARLKLNFLPTLAAASCPQPPTLDGKLDEPLWAGAAQHTLPFTSSEVFLRYDDKALYIALRRPTVFDRLGKFSPWTGATSGENAEVWKDDSCEVFLSSGPGSPVVHLGVSASGARYDALGKSDAAEDKAWDAPWQSAALGNETGLAFELAVPWSALEAAGINKQQLGVNVQINQKDVTAEALKYPGNAGRNYNTPHTTAEAICNLGIGGRARCINFVPLGLGVAPAPAPRLFTVRLHFAELDDVPAGQRVFAIKLQGQTVLENFDVVKAAGGVRKAVVKEFSHVSASAELLLEFVPAVKDLNPDTAPILSGFEMFDEQFQPIKTSLR